MDNPRYTAEGFGVDFSASVLATILAESIRAGRRETGGVLLGGYSEGLDVASVVEALGPPRDSRAGATWFHRGSRASMRPFRTVGSVARPHTTSVSGTSTRMRARRLALRISGRCARSPALVGTGVQSQS